MSLARMASIFPGSVCRGPCAGGRVPLMSGTTFFIARSDEAGVT